jgi:hypothetical protein
LRLTCSVWCSNWAWAPCQAHGCWSACWFVRRRSYAQGCPRGASGLLALFTGLPRRGLLGNSEGTKRAGALTNASYSPCASAEGYAPVGPGTTGLAAGALPLHGSPLAAPSSTIRAGASVATHRPGRPRVAAPHPCGVAAASASTRASSSGRESMGWWSVGSSTTRSALLANSLCASGGVARSSAHTT